MPRSLFPADNAAGFEMQRVTLTLGDPMSYRGRPGYDPQFVDPNLPPVPMPKLPSVWNSDRAPSRDVDTGKTTHVLKYQHFSVVQSKSRRMPYYSCCNVNGKREQDIERTDNWIYDPRLDTEYQLIKDGIYGNAGDGLFSRGHMTRREDPNWGSKPTATRADADTFHVTNACPQYQSFNAPIWLGLEDYILDNANEDNMRVSVFTGPVFDDDNDPVYAPKGLPEIQLSAQFWKIVVFKHDDTGELACAAYVASQAAKLPRKNLKPAFVFGKYDDFQLTVAELEQITYLDFGLLVQADVLAGGGDGLRLKVKSLDQLVIR
jgi:endonuclease G, mitochondrial